MLDDAGYTKRQDPVYLQCFDADELQRIRASLGSDLRLIQLIGANEWRESPTDYGELVTSAGLRKLAETVDGIGPWLPQVYRIFDHERQPVPSGLVASAHAQGLCVHPFTYRADDLSPGFNTLRALVRFSWLTLGVDGMFTDFPDMVRNYLSESTDSYFVE